MGDVLNTVNPVFFMDGLVILMDEACFFRGGGCFKHREPCFFHGNLCKKECVAYFVHRSGSLFDKQGLFFSYPALKKINSGRFKTQPNGLFTYKEVAALTCGRVLTGDDR
jgi:hypothetical protein